MRMDNAMAETRHGEKPAEPIPDAKKTASEPPADPASLAALQAELADTKEKLLRALAEQQNIRHQMQRQREEAVKYAASQLTEDLLDTLDNLRRAIESLPPEASAYEPTKPLLKGVEATEGNLLATLARHGMQRIDALGATFDPHRHHAVFQRSDATAAEGTVIEVLQPGYVLHGRVLRPAMVGVAAGQGDNGKGAAA